LSFFIANYFAHAATVRANPGEDWKDFTFAVVLAIAFPFSGVARGLEAIIRRLRGYRRSESALRKAARAGALCIVVRDENWQSDAETVIGGPLTVQGIKATRGSGPRPLTPTRNERSFYGPGTKAVSFGIAEEYEEYNLKRVTSENVHGLRDLPLGFALATLPSNADVVPHVTEHLIRISICALPSLADTVWLYQARTAFQVFTREALKPFQRPAHPIDYLPRQHD
jgi:hypothetical protein